MTWQGGFPEELTHQVTALPSFQAQPNASLESDAMNQVMRGLLTLAAPRLKTLPAFQLPFRLTCTTFFLSNIHEVSCEVDFETKEELAQPSCQAERADFSSDLAHLQKTHMIQTNITVGKGAGAQVKGQYWLYFKLPPTSTISFSEEKTESLTQTQSSSFLETDTLAPPPSLSFTATQSPTSSRSPTGSRSTTRSTSRTLNQTRSASLSPTVSRSNSVTASTTHSSSATGSQTMSRTQDMSRSVTESGASTASSSASGTFTYVTPPAITKDIVMVWTGGADAKIYARYGSALGDVQGNQFTITNIFGNSWPAVAAQNNRRYVVVWSLTSVYARLYDVQTGPLAPAFQVDSGVSPPYGSVVASQTDGSFMVSWYTDSSKIYGRVYNSTGGALGAEFQVSSGAVTNVYPRITSLKNGGYLVAWYGNDGVGTNNIFARRYDNAGNPQGSPFQVNTGGQNYFASPAGLSDGGWIIVWEDSAVPSVYGRRYDNTGTPLSAPFQIDTVARSTYGIKVIELDNGGYLVGWAEYTNRDILARWYTNAGPVGGPQQINTGPGNTCSNSYLDITVLKNITGTVFTWCGGSNSTIYQSWYNGTTPLGNQTQVNSLASTGNYGPVIAALR